MLSARSHDTLLIKCISHPFTLRGARWLSGRALDFGGRGRGFETYLRLVVSLSKTLYSPKVLVIPRKRWLKPDMTEKIADWDAKP